MLILADVTTIDIPVLPSELILPAFLTLIIWLIWSGGRNRDRAERIQQDAQELVNKEFETKQKVIDELNAKQIAADLQWHKLTTDNNAFKQRVNDLEGHMGTQKQYYETMVTALKQSIGLAETRNEALLTERESLVVTVKHMENELQGTRTGLKSALTRIDELEKLVKKQVADMEQFSHLLTQEQDARQAAEKALADLHDEMEHKIMEAVEIATSPLLLKIEEKDQIIISLQKKIEENQ